MKKGVIYQEPDHYKLEKTEWLYVEGEPVCCAKFGCGKHLTPEENLYGKFCINHQIKSKIDAANFISYPQKKSA